MGVHEKIDIMRCGPTGSLVCPLICQHYGQTQPFHYEHSKPRTNSGCWSLESTVSSIYLSGVSLDLCLSLSYTHTLSNQTLCTYKHTFSHMYMYTHTRMHTHTHHIHRYTHRYTHTHIRLTRQNISLDEVLPLSSCLELLLQLWRERE